MGWLWAIIVGFVLGLLAKAIIPGKQHSPLWLTTIFGIIGSDPRQRDRPLASASTTPSGIDWSRHVLQLVGAIVIVFLGDMLCTRRCGATEQRA